jgi:septal ring factor EnvC (AmiA/AmiB activator)
VLAVLVGAVVLIVCAARWFREREARVHRAAQTDAELANVERQVDRAAAELTELQQTIADTAQTATADLAAIRARLHA